MQYVKIPGCPIPYGCILQYAIQQAFLAILTHNPLRRGRYAAMCHATINKAKRPQTFDSPFHRMTDTALTDESTFKCRC